MQGHDEETMGAMLKIRLETELKRKVAALAKRRRKTTAGLLREKLWQIVDEDEKTLPGLNSSPATEGQS